MLYPHVLLNKASPKTISRRTSYIRVRLEFRRYPQVIPKLFNAYEFGPPLDFTQASTCSWIGHPVSGLFFGNLVWPLAPSVLYPHVLLNKASPKTISRRTSYIRVRLEFLRYPQVIPKLFNAYEFGPPLDFTQASTCSWIGHPVSGLFHMTYTPFSDSFSLRLRTFST